MVLLKHLEILFILALPSRNDKDFIHGLVVVNFLN